MKLIIRGLHYKSEKKIKEKLNKTKIKKQNKLPTKKIKIEKKTKKGDQPK